jgi:hypothetical protein
VERLYEAEETAFRLLIVPDGEQRSELEEELEEETAPTIEQGLVELRQVHSGDPPDELARVEQLAEAWARFERLWQSGALDSGSAAARRATSARVASILEPATELAAEMAAIETRRRTSPGAAPRRPTAPPARASCFSALPPCWSACSSPWPWSATWCRGCAPTRASPAGSPTASWASGSRPAAATRWPTSGAPST